MSDLRGATGKVRGATSGETFKGSTSGQSETPVCLSCGNRVDMDALWAAINNGERVACQCGRVLVREGERSRW